MSSSDGKAMSGPAAQYRLSIDGVSGTLPCAGDQTLLAALTKAGVLLEANCGGRGVCGKCKVQLLAGQVAEDVSARVQADLYLACKIYPRGDMTIKLTSAAASAKGKIRERYEDDGHPLLQKVVVAPTYPTLADCCSLQEMIGRAASGATLPADAAVMRQLPGIAATKPELVTLVLFDDAVISVEAGDTSDSLFGVAFDIGTTTVVGLLVDAKSNRVVTSHSLTNPQATFGADVISRIDAAAAPAGLAAEAEVIRQCLNQIIAELCRTAAISPDRIYAATIAGNATMEHLLMAISPVSLAVKPYVSVFRQLAPFAPAVIELGINACGKVILLPNIASFVGADTTAAVLAADQDMLPGQSLLVDLGTNGEMVLGNSDKLFACSTACGPAFEGAHIRDGMRAAPGAITDVTLDEDVRVTTIGDGRPAGLCGSGIVKAVAELLRIGIIAASGRFDRNVAGLPPALAGRLKQKGDQWEYVLVDGADSATGLDIAITQNDIRQIQLVKSAICSGIEILLEKASPAAGMPVFLAGAFGNYIDIDSALLIGLLPGFQREQVRSIGNAAGIGAVLALLSRARLARCTDIANQVEYVELAATIAFQQKFLANLAFPEVL